jgi:general secretion pathway protein A
LGHAGLGKSLLLDSFRAEQRSAGNLVALVSLVGLSAEEFLDSLVEQLGGTPLAAAAMYQRWRRLVDLLAELRYQQLTAVLLLDDADAGDDDVLAQVARLVQLEPGADATLSAVLAADPRNLAAVGMRLLDLAELRIDLEAWEPADTAAYVRRALIVAGGRASTFSDPALARLHELSSGVPRRVAQLAGLALLAGAGQRLPQVDAACVEAACQELGVVAV